MLSFNGLFYAAIIVAALCLVSAHELEQYDSSCLALFHGQV